MLIRPALQTDIPKILPMIAQICAMHQLWDSAKYGFLPNPESLYDKWLIRLIKNSQNLCLVAEVNDRLVGMLLATVEQEIPVYKLKEYAFIHDLWVEADYRKQGIAKQMLQKSIAHFQSINIAQIRLDTAIANDAARKLFSECGFRASTIEMLIEL